MSKWPRCASGSAPRSSDDSLPSNVRATQADLKARDIVFVPFVPRSDRDECPIADNLPLEESELYSFLDDTYVDEDSFSGATLHAHATMVNMALKVCQQPFLRKVETQKDRIIYTFTDEALSKTDLFVGLVKESWDDSEIDLAVALYERKKVGNCELAMANSSVEQKEVYEGTKRVGTNPSGEKIVEKKTPTRKFRLPMTAHRQRLSKGPILGEGRCVKPLKQALLANNHEGNDGEMKSSGKEIDSVFYYEFVCYLAIMELKMSDHEGLDEFARNTKNGMIVDPDFATEHSMLNQEMSYVIRKVWRGISSCGLARKRIPLFAIVGKKVRINSAHKLCCLEGELIVADKCGYNFQYTISSFGTFAEASKSCQSSKQGSYKVKVKKMAPEVEKKAIKKAPASQEAIPAGQQMAPAVKLTARVCRRFVSFGFAAALEAVEMIAQTEDNKPVCLPLSGEQVVLEGSKSNLDPDVSMDGQAMIASSPFIDEDIILYPSGTLKVLSTAASTQRHGADVNVSLADLFDGTLLPSTLRNLYYEPREQSIESLWFCDPPGQSASKNAPFESVSHDPPSAPALLNVLSESDNQPVHVIVKVSSRAVHTPSLVELKYSFVSLTTLRDCPHLRKKVSKVVLVVFKVAAGVVTIMRDLRREGYKVLQISKIESVGGEVRKVPLFRMNVMWNALSDEVQRDLLPLAEVGIVHCDIRPGYDVTSNILVKELKGTYDMVVIDYESFVDFELLPIDFAPDGRFLPRRFAKDAVGYLWWQCLSLAFVYANQIYQEELREDEGKGTLATVLTNLSLHASTWSGPRTDYDEEEVKVDEQGGRFVLLDLEDWLFSDATIRNIIRSTRHVYLQAKQVEDLLKRVSLYFEGKAIQYLGNSNDEDTYGRIREE